MRTKRLNQFLAAALSIVMVLSLMVVPAGAAKPMGAAPVAETPAEGAGSAGLSGSYRPVVKDAPAELLADEADTSKIDVYDFGAEQLDASKYNNMLTVDEINGWYSSMDPVPEAGSAGIVLPSFTTTDGTLSYDNGGATNHRLRTTNTALTRNDSASLTDADKVTYTGYIYSNSNSVGDKVSLTLNTLKAGDKVTYVFTSNNNVNPCHINFSGPNGVEDVFPFTYNSSAKAQAHTFYPLADGAYKVFFIEDKLCVARIYVEHPSTTAVSGSVTGYDNTAMSGMKLVFTNDVTGVVTKAEVAADGKYTAQLQNYQAGAAYTLSVEDALGVVISSGDTLALTAGETTKTHAVSVETVVLKEISGAITGLSDDAKAKLVVVLEKPEAKIHVPPITLDNAAGTWATLVEPGVEYKVIAKNVNDFVVTTPTVTYTGTEAKTDADLAFEAKPTYAITITPDGVAADTITKATFTLLNEGGETEDENLVPYDAKGTYHYVYEFDSLDGITLRDGTYDVKVESSAGTQKLTSNLKVNGAAATKTVKFDTAPAVVPTEWNFRSGSPLMGQDGGKLIQGTEETWQSLVIDATTGKFDSLNRSDWAQFNTGAVIKVPVDAVDGQTVKVTVSAYFNGVTTTLKVGDTANDKDQVDSSNAQVIETTAQDGYITITATASDYIGYIKVEPVEEDDTIYTKWEFNAADFTDGTYDVASGEKVYNKLVIGDNLKKENGKTHVTGGSGTITIPVVADCQVDVTVYYAAAGTIGEGEGAVELKTTNSTGTTGTTDTVTYNHTGGAGTVPITITGTTYITKIELTYGDDVVIDTGADITVTVGADKDYQTINDALDAVKAMKRKPGQKAIIAIDPGDYEEMLVVNVPNVTLKNAKADEAELSLTNKGVDIGANEVRITSYYGHAFNYYSMGTDCRWDADVLEVNKENGYASYTNPGGNTNDCYWNATVLITADGFAAEGIIFENSFNQYVSKKAAEDVIVPQASAQDNATAPRATLKTVGDTAVQDYTYVDQAAALAIKNGAGNATFDHCAFIGRQDVLDGGTSVKAAFYNCDIYGGTDYIMGPMTAVFAKCNLVLNVSENKNDVAHITAAQNAANTNGFLMYNCTVTSTEPGVNTASEKRAKPSDFGRPWSGNNAEAVFYKTIVEATDPAYFTDDLASTSLIMPKGWQHGLGGDGPLSGEYGTMEWYDGVDNSAARDPLFGGVFAEAKSKVNGKSLEDYKGWLNNEFDAFFDDHDMTVEEHTPVTVEAVDKDALTEAIAAAKAEAAGVSVSEDGSDVSTKNEWVQQEAMDDLEAAIKAAEAEAAKPVTTQADVNAAKDALDAAVEAFKALKNPGTKTSSGKPAIGTSTTAGGDTTTTTTVVNPDGSVATTTKDKDGNVELTVKAEDGEVLAQIKLPATVSGDAKFIDVPDDHWAAKCINDMAALGMVKGVNEDGTIFDMTSPITRGSIATILYRLSNGAAGKTSSFADVAADSWYADAIGWAANAKLITGYDETTFGPDDTITRQQLAVMIARMARMMGVDTEAHASALDAFNDGETVADWAVDGMAWCVKAGIVLGKDGERLDPAAAVTRAEAVTMLDRMIGLVK